MAKRAAAEAMRLPGIARFHVCFVEAELEEVAAYIRGEATASHENGVADGDPRPMRVYELCGAAARIDRPFGPEADYLGRLPGYNFLETTFPLRGWRRISRVRSNPRYVMWENPLDDVQIQSEYTLQYWTGSTVYRVFSQIAPYPIDPAQAAWLSVNYAAPGHIFRMLQSDRMRSVSYGEHSAGRKSFWQKGAPCAFEDSARYASRPPRERLTRNVICSYLDHLGIDPEATFQRRELDNPILFTTDHQGTPAWTSAEDAQRYRQSLERPHWTERLVDKTWH